MRPDILFCHQRFSEGLEKQLDPIIAFNCFSRRVRTRISNEIYIDSICDFPRGRGRGRVRTPCGFPSGTANFFFNNQVKLLTNFGSVCLILYKL